MSTSIWKRTHSTIRPTAWPTFGFHNHGHWVLQHRFYSRGSESCTRRIRMFGLTICWHLAGSLHAKRLTAARSKQRSDPVDNWPPWNLEFKRSGRTVTTTGFAPLTKGRARPGWIFGKQWNCAASRTGVELWLYKARTAASAYST